MMINKILLRNFKCFESQALDLRRLTLLAGLNGMGKSSVLQALLLIRQSYLDGLLPKTGLELNGSLVKMGTAQDVLYEDAQSDEFEIGIAWDDGATAHFILQYHREADVLRIDPRSLDAEIFTKVPFTDHFHYLQAERIGPRITNAVSDYQVREHRQIGSAGEYAQHFLHVYGGENVKDDSLLHPKSGAKDLRTQVQAWLNEISPGTDLRVEMRSEMDLVNLRYSFVTGEQRSNWYRSTSVGFGITYVLPVLVAVLSSRPGSIILVENPEAHLHPKGQVQLAGLLARAASAGIQVVVETHSDHVLNGIRVVVHRGVLDPKAVAIHYFSRVEEEGRVHSSVESPILDRDGRLDRWPEGFFDESDKSLEQLLEPRGR
jgi:predicted ATPase